jgi:hypothetical protein
VVSDKFDILAVSTLVSHRLSIFLITMPRPTSLGSDLVRRISH